tara:strand:- start:22989 stop:23495 length:507 start_codon:yes stop_codon:yes gene_type:complete
MLETIISSKTRLNLLIRFFLNLAKKSHLRGLANDFNDSTNSIRLELNNLTEAGYLIRKKEKNKVNYLANKNHPLFNILIELVRKHTGVEEILNNIVSSVKDLKAVYIVGDYANGIDSGIIKIFIEGNLMNSEYIKKVIKKTEKKINRKIFLIDEIDPFDDKLLIYESR